MDLDVAVVRGHAKATLVFRERGQWETLQERDLLSIISEGSSLNQGLDAHNLIIVCLFFGDHLPHVVAGPLVDLEVSDLEVDVLEAPLHEAVEAEVGRR